MYNGAGVLVVCGDAGGAAAVAPVIRLLQRDCRMTIFPMAYAQAPTIWARSEIKFESLPANASRPFVRDAFVRLKPDVVLAGTSVNEQEWEKVFIDVAREKNVPSLALLDFWSNYRSRFNGPGDDLARLPDQIAVMDDRAREEMVEAGFPPGRLVVTGQPAFDELERCRSRFDAADRRRIREELQAVDDEQLVVFLSQPLASFYGGEHEAKERIGFTEQYVFNLVTRALSQIAGRHGSRFLIAFRAHPRETCDWLPSLNDRGVRLIVSPVASAPDVLMASDLVIGMNTALLMESCYLGCLTVSVQPGLKQGDALPSNRAKASLPVYREAEVEPALEQALFDDPFRSAWRERLHRFQPQGGATSKVAEQVCRMAGLAGPVPRGHHHEDRDDV